MAQHDYIGHMLKNVGTLRFNRYRSVVCERAGVKVRRDNRNGLVFGLRGNTFAIQHYLSLPRGGFISSPMYYHTHNLRAGETPLIQIHAREWYNIRLTFLHRRLIIDLNAVMKGNSSRGKFRLVKPNKIQFG